MNIGEYNHIGADKMTLIQILKALSDETRLRILNLLRYGELCVCELEMLLGINQSNASRHLNRLANAKIINSDKRAQYVYYKINENTLKEYGFIKEILDNELIKLEICKEDLERLSKYRESGLSCDDLKDGKVCFDS
jgi:ArsR family transcriptional regulator